jgi:hypothetical protein
MFPAGRYKLSTHFGIFWYYLLKLRSKKTQWLENMHRLKRIVQKTPQSVTSVIY